MSSNGTAPGIDQVYNETLKRMPDTLQMLFLKAIQISWKTKTTPEAWKQSRIFLIHKSGTKFRSTNYRPIALLSCMHKIYSSIVEKKLRTLLETHHVLSDLQNGFRKNRSTTDSILTVLQLIHHAKINDLQLILELLDFAKAFDSAEHWAILRAMHDAGIDAEIIRVVQSLLTSATSEIILGHGCTQPIHLTRGVRQGDGLSPLLFLIFINPLLEQLAQSKRGYKVNDVEVPAQAFCDDFALFSGNTDDARAQHDIVVKFCMRNNLDINACKSAVLIRKPLDTPLMLQWKGQTIPELPPDGTYKYLGVQITITGDTTKAWEDATAKYKATVLFISRRHLTTRQRIILINKVAHAQIGYVLRHITVPVQDLEDLDAFTTNTLTSTLRARVNTDAEMWYTDWKLVSLVDLYSALHAASLIDNVLTKEASVQARLNHHLSATRNTLPLLQHDIPGTYMTVVDTHASQIALQDVLPTHAKELKEHIPGPWLTALADHANDEYYLKPKTELEATFPRVPSSTWDALRIRTCRADTNAIKTGWTTPTLTPFHDIDGTMTAATHSGAKLNGAWIFYTDGSATERKLPGRNIHSPKSVIDATSAVWISNTSAFNISFRTWGEQTVNNAELQAVEYALRVTPRQQSIVIVTDSEYTKTMCERDISLHQWKHLHNSLTLQRIHSLLDERRQAGTTTEFLKVYSHIQARLAGSDEELKKRILAHHRELASKYGQELERLFVHGNEKADELTSHHHPSQRHTTLLAGGPRFQILNNRVQMSKAPFKAIKQELHNRRALKWVSKEGKRSRHYSEHYDYERTIRPIASNNIEDDSLANYMHKVLQGALNVRDVEFKIAAQMQPEHKHHEYMQTIYDNPWCMHCASEGRQKTETFEHVTKCPQHNEIRAKLKHQISERVRIAGGNPALLPTWFSCPNPNQPVRNRNRPACELLGQFSKQDGTLGYIPFYLHAALQECSVPRSNCNELTNLIAKDVQWAALTAWRARCKTHSKALRMNRVKTRIQREQRKGQKRKFDDEPTQSNTLLRYMRPRTTPTQQLTHSTQAESRPETSRTSDVSPETENPVIITLRTQRTESEGGERRGREREKRKEREEREPEEEHPLKRRPVDRINTHPLHADVQQQQHTTSRVQDADEVTTSQPTNTLSPHAHTLSPQHTHST